RISLVVFFFFQAEDGIRDFHVTGVQTCALPICLHELLGLGGKRAPQIHGTRDLGPAGEPARRIDRHSAVALYHTPLADRIEVLRSEERRVGKECRSRWAPYH